MEDGVFVTLLLTLCGLYGTCLIICIIMTRKLNQFSRHWISTQIFYLLILVQIILRLFAFTTGIFVLTESGVKEETFYLVLSLPDNIFIVNYMLLFQQMITIFLFSHLNTKKLHLVLLSQFMRPKYRSVTQTVLILICCYAGCQALLYILLLSDVFDSDKLDIGNSIFDISLASVFMIAILYLHIRFSNKPFKSNAARGRLSKITAVTIAWSVARIIKAYTNLYLTSGNKLIAETGIQDAALETGITLVIQMTICEVICFYIVENYSFMGIFLFWEDDEDLPMLRTIQNKRATQYRNLSDVETTQRSDSYDATQVDRSSSFLEYSDLVIKELYCKKPNGLGELYRASYRGFEVMYRKINFPRMSNYVLEEFKNEVFFLQDNQTEQMTLFYGCCYNLPVLGIVVQYCSGGSLYENLHTRKRKFSLTDKLKILEDIARALIALHNIKRCHGHLSSHNILLDSKMRAKITDVGLEKIKKYAAVLLGYTNKSVWCSPEVLRDPCKSAVKVRESDDVYSFGIIIWELITEEVPLPEYIDKISRPSIWSSEDIRPSVDSQIPSEVMNLIDECWHPDPDCRPSMVTVLRKLNDLKWLTEL